MKNVLKGKLLILPPKLQLYPNHSPKNQMRMSREFLPIIISTDKPQEGDLIVGSKRDGYPLIIFSDKDPYPNAKKVIATWEHFSPKTFDKIYNKELQGNVLLLAEAGLPQRNERGYVTFMQLAIQKLC